MTFRWCELIFDSRMLKKFADDIIGGALWKRTTCEIPLLARNDRARGILSILSRDL